MYTAGYRQHRWYILYRKASLHVQETQGLNTFFIMIKTINHQPHKHVLCWWLIKIWITTKNDWVMVTVYTKVRQWPEQAFPLERGVRMTLFWRFAWANFEEEYSSRSSKILLFFSFSSPLSSLDIISTTKTFHHFFLSGSAYCLFLNVLERSCSFYEGKAVTHS